MQIVRLKELIELSSMVFVRSLVGCCIQEILHPEIRQLKTGDLRKTVTIIQAIATVLEIELPWSIIKGLLPY